MSHIESAANAAGKDRPLFVQQGKSTGFVLLCLLLGSISACGGGSSGTDADSSVERPQLGAALPEGNAVGMASREITLRESDRSGVVQVLRTGDAAGVTTVSYTTRSGSASSGADFEQLDGTLSWADGETGARDITVRVNSDVENEAVESFELVLSMLEGSDALATTQTSISIMDTPCDGSLPATVSETLRLSEPCYRMDSSMTVVNGGTLELDAGVTVVAAAETSLLINGGVIRAQGEEYNPVMFTGAQHLAGYWQGVELVSSASSDNLLKHTAISMASIGLSIDSNSDIPTFSSNRFFGNRNGALRVAANRVSLLDTSSNYTGNENDVIRVNNGNIDSPQTWGSLQVPLLIENILILDDSLTIAAGNTLLFAAGSSAFISSNGSLTAIGEPDAAIVFTGEQQSPGFWDGIQFVGSNSEHNRLENVEVSFAGGNPTRAANLILEGAPNRLSLVNSHSHGSAGYGLLNNDAGAVLDLDGTTFSNNLLGDLQ